MQIIWNRFYFVPCAGYENRRCYTGIKEWQGLQCNIYVRRKKFSNTFRYVATM